MNEDSHSTSEEPEYQAKAAPQRFKFSLRALLVATLLSGALVHINFTFLPLQVIVIDMLALAALALWIAWKVRNRPEATEDLSRDRQYLAELAVWIPMIVAFAVVQWALRR